MPNKVKAYCSLWYSFPIFRCFYI